MKRIAIEIRKVGKKPKTYGIKMNKRKIKFFYNSGSQHKSWYIKMKHLKVVMSIVINVSQFIFLNQEPDLVVFQINVIVLFIRYFQLAKR